MIIGLTSFLGAGKTTIADYLVKQGFEFHSLSDVLRDELRERGEELTRSNLQAAGNRLRRMHGSSVLADRILKKFGSGGKYVVDSIRHPEEIKALKKRDDFFLVFVDADIKSRFERVRERKREQDPMSFEDFKKAEEKELKSPDSSNQQLLNCKEMADFIIHNNGRKEELYQKVDDVLREV